MMASSPRRLRRLWRKLWKPKETQDPKESDESEAGRETREAQDSNRRNNPDGSAKSSQPGRSKLEESCDLILKNTKHCLNAPWTCGQHKKLDFSEMYHAAHAICSANTTPYWHLGSLRKGPSDLILDFIDRLIPIVVTHVRDRLQNLPTTLDTEAEFLQQLDLTARQFRTVTEHVSRMLERMTRHNLIPLPREPRADGTYHVWRYNLWNDYNYIPKADVGGLFNYLMEDVLSRSNLVERCRLGWVKMILPINLLDIHRVRHSAPQELAIRRLLFGRDSRHNGPRQPLFHRQRRKVYLVSRPLEQMRATSNSASTSNSTMGPDPAALRAPFLEAVTTAVWCLRAIIGHWALIIGPPIGTKECDETHTYLLDLNRNEGGKNVPHAERLTKQQFEELHMPQLMGYTSYINSELDIIARYVINSMGDDYHPLKTNCQKFCIELFTSICMPNTQAELSFDWQLIPHRLHEEVGIRRCAELITQISHLAFSEGEAQMEPYNPHPALPVNFVAIIFLDILTCTIQAITYFPLGTGLWMLLVFVLVALRYYAGIPVFRGRLRRSEHYGSKWSSLDQVSAEDLSRRCFSIVRARLEDTWFE